ncbi:MAG: hypothetical protein AAGI23_19900 [Bacteroidota bacterium]
MKKNLRKSLVIALSLAFAASVSSCNRGYGCPNNFSLDTVTSVVKTTVNHIVATIR